MLYRALRIEEKDGVFTKSIKELPLNQVDSNDVLIKIKYAALNYKDALSSIGNRGVTKNYPHTPGIDGAGIVHRSNCKNFKTGDEVIVTGFDLGMNTNGAFGEYISVPKEWIIPLPKNLTLKEAVGIGTAGITSAIGVDKLIKNGLKSSDKILITGATGGVGSFSVKLLSKLNFNVTALTRKTNEVNFLKNIGANEVINSIQFNPNKPLLKPIFDGCIDVVGGELLEEILKQIKYGGSVSICGLISSPKLNTSVFPFILRGINLLGIDSVEISRNYREFLWNKLSNEWKIDLNSIIKVHSLDDLPNLLDNMLKGKSVGRIVIKI